MKRIKGCLLMLTISTIMYAQSPVKDATQLSKFVLASNGMFDDSKSDLVKAILVQYVDTMKGETVRSRFKNKNPFIKSMFSDNFPMSGGVDAAAVARNKGLLGSIGGLDVTNIADGLARFLVRRAKQELSITFFHKLKVAIDSTKDLVTLFPQTSNLLGSMGEEIYEYEAYIQNLREAFKRDISAIHHNLPGIVDNHAAFFDTHKEIKAALLSGCYIASELENHTHPGDILANYPLEYLDGAGNKNFSGAIQTIQLLSASLRNNDPLSEGDYWVNIQQMRELVNSRLAFKIYLGLVYEEAFSKYEGVQYEGASLLTMLDAVAANYDKVFAVYDTYKRYILRFGDKVEALNTMIHAYDKPATDSAALEQYAKYFKASVDMIEYCTAASKLPFIKGTIPNLDSLLHNYFEVAYQVTDLVTDINRRNYSAAINHAVRIYSIVLVEPAEEALARALADLSGREEAAKAKATLYKLVKYGGFMASVATAKNSDDVANAIESAALPVGSARIKRISRFNVSVNAYAGAFIGHEWIKGVKDDKTFNAFGITAPVGIAASWGSTRGWSKSIFVSLVDLGAVAAFRLKDDSTAQVPTIQLKHIVSPGAFFSLGFPNTPLSFNLGAQIGPNLRKVSSTVNDFSDRMYVRVSASLLVDLPLLNLYTKSR